MNNHSSLKEKLKYNQNIILTESYPCLRDNIGIISKMGDIVGETSEPRIWGCN